MMFRESETNNLMRVVLELLGLEVVALPVFESIVVREAHETQARAVMQEQFQASTGLTATIKKEQPQYP